MARKRKDTTEKVKRPLILKQQGQEYAKILKHLGNGRVEAYCYDGVTRNCTIRGKLTGIRSGRGRAPKKVWMNAGDTVLVWVDHQINLAIIEMKYSEDEIRQLYKRKEIIEEETEETNIGGIVFGEEEKEEPELIFEEI